MLKKEKKTK